MTTDPTPGAQLTWYNPAGLVTASTDALGNTTVYSYTTASSINTDGSHPPINLPYCTIDPVDYQNGVTCPAYGAAHVTGTTTATYDSAGDKLASTNAAGATTTSTYYPNSQVHTTTDPDGTLTTYTYNAAGQAILQTQSSAGYSATTQSAYDSVGQLYCTVSAANYATGVRCPASPTSPSSPPTGVTSTFYDATGQQTQQTGPTGATTISAYDDSGNAFCAVSANNYANGIRCPATPPTTHPPLPPAVISTSVPLSLPITLSANKSKRPAPSAASP